MAYERLDAMRLAAEKLRDSALKESGGGTHQARYQRDVMVQAAIERIEQLDIGKEALCFGRIDKDSDETFYIGRRAVYGEKQEPVVLDWRVPAAGPFYRATGLHPMGLVLRRHFVCDGKELLDIEDEAFSEDPEVAGLGLAGPGSLIGVLERRRTGQMRDIVATIQQEQDEIIRDELPGVLAVQGGPGTGKTAVALHRAAYLLFTHRRQLTRQGVLFVGPTRLFLRYIDRVLPALGETGVVLTTPAGMFPGVRVTAFDTDEAAKVKGDLRMVRVIARALAERQKPSSDLVIRFRNRELKVKSASIAGAVRTAQRARGSHNARRLHAENAIVRRLYSQYVRGAGRVTPAGGLAGKTEFTAEIKDEPELTKMLEEVWPLLTPQQFLSDLFSSNDLLVSACDGILERNEQSAIYRAASNDIESAGWTVADIALLEEASTLLGDGSVERVVHDDDEEEEDLDRPTYGHIVVDEAQDLSAMQLRMIARRSHFGSMTIVGDMAQSTSSGATSGWDEILSHLPNQRGQRLKELSINYRTPSEIMDCAASLLAHTAPDLKPATSVRSTGEKPEFILVEKASIAAVAAKLAASASSGSKVAIVCAHLELDGIRAGLIESGLEFEQATDRGLTHAVTLITADAVKGLEFDVVIAIEPAAIVRESAKGLSALYVVLTRATKTVAVLHSEALPQELNG